MRIQVEKAMTNIRPAVESAAAITRSIRDRCAYGLLQLTDIAIWKSSHVTTQFCSFLKLISITIAEHWNLANTKTQKHLGLLCLAGTRGIMTSLTPGSSSLSECYLQSRVAVEKQISWLAWGGSSEWGAARRVSRIRSCCKVSLILVCVGGRTGGSRIGFRPKPFITAKVCIIMQSWSYDQMMGFKKSDIDCIWSK